MNVEFRKEHPSLLTPEHLKRKDIKLVTKYYKRWRSKSLYQVLLMYRAKIIREFSDFSQQVHLYNQHVFHMMTANNTRTRIMARDMNKNTTYEEFIGHPKPIPLRIPFQLRHKSSYVTEENFDPYAPKSTLFGENEDWDAPLRRFDINKERQHFIFRHAFNVKDIGIQVNMNDDNTEKDDEPGVLIYHYATGTCQVESKYAGRHLGRDLSVYSVVSERNTEKMEEVDASYEQPTNLTKVFMQLMCPSCCGGIFSETKGSVYMKRPTVRPPSKSKSVITTTSSEIILESDEDELQIQIEDENAEDVKRNLSPIPENHDEQPNAPPTPKQSPAISNKSDQKAKESRSLSLGDALCQELNQNKSLNGEVEWNNKLRKTSYTPSETDIDKMKKDTVIELKIRGKEHVEVVKQNGDDNPPFNFQAILRKTSNPRPSLKRAISTEKDKANKDNYFIAELFPGVTLQGIAYDL